jgi:succinyl-CoA synthetase alpha subunit
MSILVDNNTRLVVQGITGKEGSFHARGCLEYGTKVVAGVTPGKGGMIHEGIPVFNSVIQSVQETAANTSLIFVPPAFAADAILEAADAGIGVIVCITEGIPALDMVKVSRYLQGKTIRLVGPNCPGVWQLTQRGIGQSTCVGVGGDQIIGTNFVDCLHLFRDDPQTEAVLLIGEIGGTAEEEAATFVKTHIDRTVIGYVAGMTAPPGRRMGHAGAIIAGGKGTATEKVHAMEAAGIRVCRSPDEMGVMVEKSLQGG